LPDDLGFQNLYAQICHEWDEAEKDLKNAEQVCGEVVIPAIKELRYAGRRLAQALQLQSSGGDRDAVEKLLQDACFDCHRARHDAIDAATAQISKVLDIATDKLGYDVVMATFPDFAGMMTQLNELRAKIVSSRGSAKTRDEIYELIEASDFPELVASFHRFQSFEPIMLKMAGKRRALNLITIAIGVIAIIATLVDIALHELH